MDSKPINVAIWPARVPNKDVKAEEMPEGGAAGGGYNMENKTAYLPLHDDAYHRTIRLHEALHAIYTDRRPGKFIIDQAIEDARLHLNFARTDGEPRRDEIAVAMRDLRNIRMRGTMGPSINDLNLLLMLRSMAILRGGTKHPEFTDKLRKQAASRHGEDVWPIMDQALDLIAKEDLDGAKALLSSKFKNVVSSAASALGAGQGGKQKGGDKLDLGPLFGAVQAGVVSTDSIDFLGKPMQDRIARQFRDLPKLTVHDLSHVNSFKTYEGPSEKMLMSGSHIRAKKLAVAAVSPVPIRIFTRKVKMEGGTILIDASGSMRIDDQVLRALSHALPFGTIAYYSAPHDSVNYGNLVIYAKNGRRHSIPVGERMPERGSGNVVDFAAIQWLLKQEPKRYLVSDGGWTGSRLNIDAAQELATNAAARKAITWVTGLPKLFDVLPEKAFESLPEKVKDFINERRERE